MLAGMSQSETGPPVPGAEGSSSKPNPLSAPVEPTGGHKGKFREFICDLGDKDKRPWWLVLLGGAVLVLPQAADGLHQLYKLSRDLSGDAAVFLAALSSPLLAISLITLGILGIILADSVTSFGRALGAFGRILAVALIAVCAAAGLFGHLIASSDMPAAVKHYRRASEVRQASQMQREILFRELHRAADVITPFQVIAGRDPESIQYADDLIDALLAAGLRLTNGARPNAKAEIVDFRSTTLRGLLLFVKDPKAPPRAADLIGNAFKSAGISFVYGTLEGETGEKFILAVAPN
jgi:hypothetical protein